MLKELLNQKADIEQRMRDLQATIEPELAIMRDLLTSITTQISDKTRDGLDGLRRLQAKEYGVVHLVIDGVKVSQTVTKKVAWDQEKLNSLFDRIQASGDNPRNYMKVELKVGEKEYDKFAPAIKSIFAEARTVTPGAPTVKFEEVPSA